ncbi:hypothetical protein MFIFM68171_04932 [Madurella fahalii]|uniref:CFEM domain-containing protein n=1 Tax=Madurella fahalii TaxID=1157608 RepID=A0ABQ0GAD6_9PEZI
MDQLTHVRPPLCALTSVIFCLVFLTPRASAQDPTVSLSTYTAYSVQRTCVQQCLIGPHTDGAPGVIRDLGCTVPMLDSCYCRTAMAAEVSAGMATCISSYCGNKTADLSAALSLYDHYCAGDLTVVTSAATVSLDSDNEMAAQRDCVRGCMMSRPPDGGTNLPRALQCTASPAYDDCLCRPDLTTEANSHLTSCVNEWCPGNTAEIASAVSLYGSYCNAARQAVPTDSNGVDESHTAATPGGSSTNGKGPLLPDKCYTAIDFVLTWTTIHRPPHRDRIER